jgi:hypothetical protein
MIFEKRQKPFLYFLKIQFFVLCLFSHLVFSG